MVKRDRQMIDKIKNFFSKNVIEPEVDTVTPQQIASAALLIEGANRTFQRRSD